MVQAFIDDRSHTGRIILKPNYSWSWRYNTYLLYTLAGISLGLGVPGLPAFLGTVPGLPATPFMGPGDGFDPLSRKRT